MDVVGDERSPSNPKPTSQEQQQPNSQCLPPEQGAKCPHRHPLLQASGPLCAVGATAIPS